MVLSIREKEFVYAAKTYGAGPLRILFKHILPNAYYYIIVSATPPGRMKSVVLSYSGGLDTSVCIPLLREKFGFDRVVTVTVDVGQDPGDIRQAEERATAYFPMVRR